MLNIKNNVKLMIIMNQEKFEKICSRSEIGSIPETDDQRDLALIHTCNNCNEEYFCPDLTIEDNSKCNCQHMTCFICFNDVC